MGPQEGFVKTEHILLFNTSSLTDSELLYIFIRIYLYVLVGPGGGGDHLQDG